MESQIKLPHVVMKPSVAPPRPIKDSTEITRAVAMKIAYAIGHPPNDKQVEEAHADLENANSHYGDILDVLTNLHSWDGYTIGRELDDARHWDIDADIVEEFDRAEHYRYSEHEIRVKNWVKEYELTPKYALNDRVSVEVHRKKHTGTITRIYEDTLRYVVTIPELGHGIKKDGYTTYGLVFEEEHLRAADPEGSDVDLLQR